MKYVLTLLVIVTINLYSSEIDHSSFPHTEIVEKLCSSLFGICPHDFVIERIAHNIHSSQRNLREVAERISESSGDSIDSKDEDEIELKKLIMESMHQVIEETHLQASDAQMQLKIQEKALRNERIKLYGSMVTTIASISGLGAAIVAYNTN